MKKDKNKCENKIHKTPINCEKVLLIYTIKPKPNKNSKHTLTPRLKDNEMRN